MERLGYTYLEDNYTICQAARKLQIGLSNMDICYFLLERNIIDTEGKPYYENINNGDMFLVCELYPKESSIPREIYIPYFTPKGLMWLKEILLEYKLTKKK